MESDKLSFIKDASLRKTIEDSIQFIPYLLKNSEAVESEQYKEETYRIIILYVIAIIEAILLYIYKKRGEEMLYDEYKHIKKLPDKFKHQELLEESVIIAVQKKSSKNDSQIGVRDLVNFFKESGLMKKEFAKEILDLNDIRNTFHFSKSRTNINCEIGEVENSLDLLVRVIKKSPAALSYHIN